LLYILTIMRGDVAINLMINDLREILINNSTFPKENEIKDPDMKRALREFKKRFKPTYKTDLKVGTVEKFIEKHNLFHMVKKYLDKFEELGSKIIIIEGADGPAKLNYLKE
jgi:hypothetical protein